MLGSKPRWLKKNVQNGNVYFDGTMSDHPKIAELNSKQFFFKVCNAVYTRFNFTQPLCACADRFQGPCSASIARNDYHTIEVGMKKNAKVNDSTQCQIDDLNLCTLTSIIDGPWQT